MGLQLRSRSYGHTIGTSMGTLADSRFGNGLCRPASCKGALGDGWNSRCEDRFAPLAKPLLKLRPTRRRSDRRNPSPLRADDARDARARRENESHDDLVDFDLLGVWPRRMGGTIAMPNCNCNKKVTILGKGSSLQPASSGRARRSPVRQTRPDGAGWWVCCPCRSYTDKKSEGKCR